MFPTRSKAKVSKLMSYPIGAEALSTALEGIPQSSCVELSFGRAHIQQASGQGTLPATLSYRRSTVTICRANSAQGLWWSTVIMSRSGNYAYTRSLAYTEKP